ncbi:MAG: efflux RND transporter periplasmic adaptor subunit [Eubacterium sp.]|nr:efflux RND transporter periplasmic adaptor subunit [Eubacterium sp.]
MKKKKKALIITLIVLVIAGGCGAFFVPKLFSKSEARSGRSFQTNTVSLSKMDLTESVSATGTIESAETTTVSADVQNVTVKKVLVEVGDTVKKGQSLVSFDKSDLQEAVTEAQEDYADTVSQNSTELSQAYQQLSDARSTYASDKKKLEQVVKEAKAALKKAQKRAKSTSTKKKASASASVGSSGSTATASTTGTGDGSVPNIGTGSGTGTSGSGNAGTTSVTITDNMTVAEAKAALKQAKENLASTNKQNLKSINSAKQAVSQAQTSNKKQLRQAKRSMQDAKKTLKSASIKATMDGTVTALGVSEGSTYNGGDAVEISDLSSFQVTTTVTEYDINKVKVGQRVVILTDATGDEEIEGEISYVALTMGSTTLSSGSTSAAGGSSSGMSMGGSSSSSSGYEVVIKLKAGNDQIRSGMTAKCSIIINEASDVYAVPYDAIHTNSSNEDVIYVKDSSGSQKEIKVTKGMESDYYVEVSSSELSDGLSVIIPSDESTATGSSDEDSSGDGFGFMMGGGSFPGGGSGGPPSDFSGSGGPSSGGFPGMN